ncbi:hypothetical protein B0H10DRAFT_1957477 [Mycena sp. CBHHK59/15]|nr:hypothetical protein B0H10DRAFT_1957477 [Mycena sp. CBHHK59/15]
MYGVALASLQISSGSTSQVVTQRDSSCSAFIQPTTPIRGGIEPLLFSEGSGDSLSPAVTLCQRVLQQDCSIVPSKQPCALVNLNEGAAADAAGPAAAGRYLALASHRGRCTRRSHGFSRSSLLFLLDGQSLGPPYAAPADTSAIPRLVHELHVPSARRCTRRAPPPMSSPARLHLASDLQPPPLAPRAPHSPLVTAPQQPYVTNPRPQSSPGGAVACAARACCGARCCAGVDVRGAPIQVTHVHLHRIRLPSPAPPPQARASSALVRHMSSHQRTSGYVASTLTPTAPPFSPEARARARRSMLRGLRLWRWVRENSTSSDALPAPRTTLPPPHRRAVGTTS